MDVCDFHSLISRIKAHRIPINTKVTLLRRQLLILALVNYVSVVANYKDKYKGLLTRSD